MSNIKSEIKKLNYKNIVDAIGGYNVRLEGVYIFADEWPHNIQTTEVLVKIGKTIDLKKRLNSYQICFPNGMYVVALLYPEALNDINSENKQVREARKRLVHNVERELHEKLHEKRAVPNLLNGYSKRKPEWFKVTLSELKKLLFDKSLSFHKLPSQRDKVIVSFASKKQESVYDSYTPDIKGDFRPDASTGEQLGNSRATGKRVYRLSAGPFTELEKWRKSVFPVGTKIDIWVEIQQGRLTLQNGKFLETTIVKHVGTKGAVVRFSGGKKDLETYDDMDDLYFRRTKTA